MRRIQRTALADNETVWLAKQTSKILAKPDAEQAKEAKRLWESAKQNQQRNPLRHIQAKLQAMCSGLERCMYCEDSQGTAIEHFYPRESRPDRAFVWPNLLFACAHCNSNEKRTQFPQAPDGQPLLIDPTAEDPLDHILLAPSTGRLEPRLEPESQKESEKGRASIDTFALNRAVLEAGRHDAWVSIQELIIRYDAHLSAGNADQAEHVRLALCRFPFSSVLVHLLRLTAKKPPGLDAMLLQAECIAALARRPEIATWIVS